MTDLPTLASQVLDVVCATPSLMRRGVRQLAYVPAGFDISNLLPAMMIPWKGGKVTSRTDVDGGLLTSRTVDALLVRVRVSEAAGSDGGVFVLLDVSHIEKEQSKRKTSRVANQHAKRCTLRGPPGKMGRPRRTDSQ